jgi:multiple sugar transport system substrate-binding protein
MDQRQLRNPLSASLALALAVTLGGCSGVARSDPDVVHLDFWNGFSGPDGEQMERMVAAFNEEHAGEIEVRMQIIAWGTYYDKVTLGLAFGGAPEVFVLHVNRFPEFASHEVLADLGPYVQASGFTEQEFVDAAWEASFWEGDQMALPLDTHPLGLYYNLDLFEQAGIQQPPQTYEEFIQVAEKLTKDEDGDGRKEQWGFAYTWLHSNATCFLNQYGVSILNEDLTGSGLNDPRAEAAMERMIQIIDAGVAPPPEGQDAWLGFRTGRVAMALEGVYMMTGLQEQEDLRFAAAPVPQFGPEKAVWAGSHLLTVPAGLDPETEEAAWEFIKYLSDNSLIWAEGGQVPVRRSLLETPEFQAMEIQAEFAKQLDYVVYEPQSTSYNLVATFGDSAFEAILNGIAPPEEALQTASRRINNVMERQ